jgi:hypothetical protein
MYYKRELNDFIYDRMKQAKVIFNYPDFQIPITDCDLPFFFPPLV